MKNKVMGKALSWVLSAAMALTMSGAIPAMTSTVYAGTSGTTLYFADKAVYDTGESVSYGSFTKSDNTKTALSWSILAKGAENDSKTADGNLSIQATTDNTGAYSEKWADSYNFDTAESAALIDGTISGTSNKTVNVTKDGATQQTTGTNTGVTTKITRNALSSGNIWLPSFDETVAGLESTSSTGTVGANGVYWTRDTSADSDFSASLATDNSRIDSTTYHAAITVAVPASQSSGSTTATANSALASLTTAKYAPHANLNVKDRKSVLFAAQASGSWIFTLPAGDTVKEPSISNVAYTGTGKATVTFSVADATPETEQLYYIITDAAASTAASITANGTVDLTGTGSSRKGTITLANTDLSSNSVYVYVYYGKITSPDPTIEASNLVKVSASASQKPTTDNIEFSGKLTTAVYGTAITKDAFTTDTTPSDATADIGAVTGSYVIKEGTTTHIALPTVLDVGKYDYYGSIESHTSYNGSILYDAADDLKFGTFEVTKYPLEASDISAIAFSSVSQYSPISYDVDSAVATLTTPVSGDKVTLTNLKVTLAAGATDTENKSGVAPDEITFSGVDSKNYKMSATPITATDGTCNASLVKVTADTLSTVDVCQQPTNTYVVKNDNSVAATVLNGLMFKMSYKNGGEVYKSYEKMMQHVSTGDSLIVSPSVESACKTTGTKTLKFTYKLADGTSYACETPVTLHVVTAAVTTTEITLPASASVNNGSSISAPQVTYEPSNATDRAITWNWTTKGSTNGAIKCYDATGEELQTGTTTPIASIKGSHEGTVILTATLTSSIGAGKTAISDTETIKIGYVAEDVTYKRVFGDTRYDTAAAVAKEVFGDDAGDTAILVSGEAYPDALTANGLAGKLECPILFTMQDSIPSSTATLLKKWNFSHIIIVGGNKAVSEDIESSLKSDYGVTTVDRCSGDTRTETANDVYEKGGFSKSKGLIIVSGAGPADALSMSPWAYNYGMPIVLTQADGTLDDATMKIAKAVTGTIYIAGGTSVVASSVESTLKSLNVADDVVRLFGADRYATSSAIASYFAAAEPESTTVTGTYNYTCFASCVDNDHFADALASGMLAGTIDLDGTMGTTDKTSVAPILLVDGTSGAGFNLVKSDYATTDTVNSLYFVGGSNVIPAATINKIVNNWANPTEYTDE